MDGIFPALHPLFSKYPRVQNVRLIHLPSDKNGAVPGGF